MRTLYFVLLFILFWPAKTEGQTDTFMPVIAQNDISVQAARLGTFYVSPGGSNGDGSNWTEAWTAPDKIDWSLVRSGSTILLDSGTYRSDFRIEKDGITIRLGRGDQAILMGRDGKIGRCGSGVAIEKETIPTIGIKISGSGVTVDGVKPAGIVVAGFGFEGIRIEREANNVKLGNLEIRDNGSHDGETRNGSGIRVGGAGHVLRELNVFDNGQDAIMSLHGENNLSQLTIINVWLHNTNDASYPCTHSDGLQIYSGGAVSGVLVQNSRIGPNLANGLILGDSGSVEHVIVTDVEIDNVIIAGVYDNAIISNNKGNSDWSMTRLDIDCEGSKNCLDLQGSNFRLASSNIRNGNVFMPGVTLENNCLINVTGIENICPEETQPKNKEIPCSIVLQNAEHGIKNITVLVDLE